MQSERYLDGTGFDQAWNQYKPDHPKPVTIGSFYMLAKAKGWPGQKPQSQPLVLTAPSDFQLLDRDAIMAQPLMRWRVKGLYPESGIAALYGASGSGKSYLALDQAMAICMGVKWFGYRTVASPVVYIMLEGEAGLRNRIAAWEKHNKLTMPDNFRAIVQPFHLFEAEQVEALGRVLPKSGMVIIDTLNRAAPGLDENASMDMGRILRGMKRLQEITQGLVLIVHHTGKDTSKGMRGHSSLHAALDGAVEVERTLHGRSWSAAKVKDGEDGRQTPFKLHVIELGTDEDGDPITSCAIGPDSDALFKPAQPTGKNQIAALKAFKQALSASTHLGRAGAGDQTPCISFEDAIGAVSGGMAGVEKKRRAPRAREALQGLIAGGHIKRGLDDSEDEWLWL